MKKSSENNNDKATDLTKRPRALAMELFGAVKKDRRLAKVEGKAGDLIFKDLESLESQLVYAFRKGLIAGRQKGANRPIWLDSVSALRYITMYVELATTQTGRVRIPAQHGAIWERADEESTHVVAGDHCQISLADELKKVEDNSHEYAVIQSGADLLRKGCLMVKSSEANKFVTLGGAAVAALEQLGYQLIRVERDDDDA